MKKLLLLLSVTTIVNAQTPFNGKLGYGISPAHFPNNSSQDAVDFYTEVSAQSCGATIMWNGSWWDSIQVAGQVPTSAHVNAIATGSFAYESINVFTFYNSPSTVWIQTAANPTPNNFSNTAARDSFLVMLARHAQNDHPNNVFVGNEMDLYYEMDSVNYPAYATFYSMAYDSIKKYSPATKVGVVLQHEHFTGQGAQVLWSSPYWNAYDLLDTSKIDQIGLTLYPFFNYLHANQINSHYLDAFKSRIGNKEVIITETGWPADHNYSSAPWTCSPQEQVDYVPILFDSLANGLNCHKIQWLYLNYLMSNANVGFQIFNSVAMRDSLGNDRPAKALWDARCQTPAGIAGSSIKHKLYYFPNPATSEINIMNESHDDLWCRLFNVMGEEVAAIMSNEAQIRLSVETLNSGMYSVVIKHGDQVETAKIIVEH